MELNSIISDFLSFIKSQVITFAAEKSAAVAGVITPAFYTCVGIYILIMGWLYITGKVEEPLMEFVKRVAKIAFVGNLALSSGMYSTYIVDTMWNSPEAIAAAFTGSEGDIAKSLGQMLTLGGTAAGNMFDSSSVTDVGTMLLALIVFLVTIIIVAYATFLITMSKILTGALLALGPLFIIGLLFNATQRFFESWIAQLANYGLVQVLTVAVNSLILVTFQKRLIEFTSLASADRSLFALIPLILMAAIAILTLPQIMGLASGVAGGISLSSMGIGHLALRGVMNSVNSTLGKGAQGAFERGAARISEATGGKVELRRGMMGDARRRVEMERMQDLYKAGTHGRDLARQQRVSELKNAANRRYADKNPSGNIERATRTGT